MSVLQRTDQVPIHRTKQENLIHASKTELEGGGGWQMQSLENPQNLPHATPLLQ